MTIEERELEDNEAKIDNILHKILKMSDSIKDLSDYININPSADAAIREACAKISIIAETINNLLMAADEIDIADESITKKLENEIKAHLDKAIENIKQITEMTDSQ